MYLKCATCSPEDYFPAPVIDGVATVSPATTTILRTSNGTVAIPICPACCDAIVAGAGAMTGVTENPNEIPASSL